MFHRYGQLSGMVEPIAGLVGIFAVSLIKPLLPYALAFAAGAMIYVVVNDIIPESNSRYEVYTDVKPRHYSVTRQQRHDNNTYLLTRSPAHRSPPTSSSVSSRIITDCPLAADDTPARFTCVVIITHNVDIIIINNNILYYNIRGTFVIIT